MQEQAFGFQGLDSLQREIELAANARTHEIVFAVLHGEPLPIYKPKLDLYEDAVRYGIPFEECRKCGILLGRYVKEKLELGRMERRDCDHLYPGWRKVSDQRALVDRVRKEFHDSTCTCGLERWRGPNWRSKQGSAYQVRYQDYLTWERNRRETERIQVQAS